MFFADLHCDLLCYLEFKKERTPFNNECRCSLPLLKSGNVRFQTLAVYTETSPQSTESAARQFEIFKTLPHLYPKECRRLEKLQMPSVEGPISILAAIENASGLCSENEKLENGFKRLDAYCELAGPILYLSLTWNHENRFGGGNLTQIGLKKDGERLLEFLSGRKMGIDLSHTSDKLAYEILDYIDKKNLKLIPLASHSNFRSVCSQPRNLPDAIAKEIAKRGGIVGLNLMKAFVGKEFLNDIARHIEKALSLGLAEHLSLGADFFYGEDTPMSLSPFYPFFHETFGNSGCYPKLFNNLAGQFTLTQLEKIAYKNFENFLNRMSAL